MSGSTGSGTAEFSERLFYIIPAVSIYGCLYEGGVTGFFGCFGHTADPGDLETYTRHAAGPATERLGPEFSPTSDSTAVLATHIAGDDIAVSESLIVGLKGRPFWAGDAGDPNPTLATAASILDRYRRSGVALLDDLHGAFSLAILDQAERKTLLAIDRMGIERLAYGWVNDVFVFSQSARTIARFPGSQAAFRQQSVFDYLFMHMIPAPETVYEGIRKLPPATALVLQDGQSTLTRYWTPSYRYAAGGEEKALETRCVELLEAAVRSQGIDEGTGAFLSGGLDSSSIVGMLCKVQDAPSHSFTVGFDEAAFNELEYSRLANRHFGCTGHEVFLRPHDIVSAFETIAAAYDEPFGNSSAVPTLYCARLAAESGMSHLLAGDGGDELFAGNERYARQQIFEVYGRLPVWLRRHLVEPMTRKIDEDSRLVPARKLRSYVDQAMIPLPERFESWNFMYREGRNFLLDDDFSARIDPRAPLTLMQDVWDSSPAEALLDRMLWYDWRFTLADNDLRKVGTMCELAGVRVSYPMLHPDLVDFSMQIPPRLKMRGTDLRRFFKRSMQNFLPDATLSKGKHGFGLPFGVWLKTDTALGDLIYSHLADLGRRDFFKQRSIDDLIDQHRAGHPGYYGYAIWDLAMLEAWLKIHIDAD